MTKEQLEILANKIVDMIEELPYKTEICTMQLLENLGISENDPELGDFDLFEINSLIRKIGHKRHIRFGNPYKNIDNGIIEPEGLPFNLTFIVYNKNKR